MAFTIYALGVAGYLRFGPAHIKGKSQALSRPSWRPSRHGGEVWLNNGAARILAEDGRIKGVVAEDGSEIACPVVVSNANPAVTCLDLLGREAVPDWYLRRLGAWSGGASHLKRLPGAGYHLREAGVDPPRELRQLLVRPGRPVRQDARWLQVRAGRRRGDLLQRGGRGFLAPRHLLGGHHPSSPTPSHG